MQQGFWQRVLAWRLLYAVLEVGTRYQTFLVSMPMHLRDSLQPTDVVTFVRQRAGIDTQNIIIIFVFDEAQTFHRIPELLSAFVQFRIASPRNTIPIVVVTSTLWSCTRLIDTASRHAKIADIQLLPLNKKQVRHIATSVCCRAVAIGQQSLASSQPAASQQPTVSWTSGHHCGANLPDVQLPATCRAVLDLVAGNPRVLAYALASIGGGGSIGSVGFRKSASSGYGRRMTVLVVRNASQGQLKWQRSIETR